MVFIKANINAKTARRQTKMAKINKQGFQKGTGCFTCDTCGKKTRLNSYDTDNGSCADCNSAFEIENAINDGQEVSKEELEFYNTQIKKWKKEEVSLPVAPFVKSPDVWKDGIVPDELREVDKWKEKEEN